MDRHMRTREGERERERHDARVESGNGIILYLLPSTSPCNFSFYYPFVLVVLLLLVLSFQLALGQVNSRVKIRDNCRIWPVYNVVNQTMVQRMRVPYISRSSTVIVIT